MTRDQDKLALVYACSGCSSAAQLANHVAVQLDRQGMAEMSCIAGVGGDVPSLVKTATSGRAIVALDGCALACVKSCLARHGVTADHYYPLQHQGIQKKHHADFDPAQAQRVLAQVCTELVQASACAAPGATA